MLANSKRCSNNLMDEQNPQLRAIVTRVNNLRQGRWLCLYLFIFGLLLIAIHPLMGILAEVGFYLWCYLVYRVYQSKCPQCHSKPFRVSDIILAKMSYQDANAPVEFQCRHCHWRHHGD